MQWPNEGSDEYRLTSVHYMTRRKINLSSTTFKIEEDLFEIVAEEITYPEKSINADSFEFESTVELENILIDLGYHEFTIQILVAAFE